MLRLLFLSIFIVGIISPVEARWRLSRKEFNEAQKIAAQDLELRGVGTKTLFMMRIFVAGLYLGKDTPSKEVLSDVPKHLEVKFYTKISARDFTNYTINRMKANLSKQEFKKVGDRFKQMGECFPNIKSGDTLSLSYEPGKGTSFVHNGQVRGIIEGGDFGKAVFATWFGNKPFDHLLKRQILGVK